MKKNSVNGVPHCPFCGSSYIKIKYSCDTYGREYGTIDEDGSELSEEEETNDRDDYEYEMDCCGESVDYHDLIPIMEGEYEIDIENEYSENLCKWDDDEEDEEKVEPRKLLLNKIICLK